jgi:hypothetical protein
MATKRSAVTSSEFMMTRTAQNDRWVEIRAKERGRNKKRRKGSTLPRSDYLGCYVEAPFAVLPCVNKHWTTAIERAMSLEDGRSPCCVCAQSLRGVRHKLVSHRTGKWAENVPEDGGSVFLWNAGIYLQVHTALQPRRTTMTCTPPW